MFLLFFVWPMICCLVFLGGGIQPSAFYCDFCYGLFEGVQGFFFFILVFFSFLLMVFQDNFSFAFVRVRLFSARSGSHGGGRGCSRMHLPSTNRQWLKVFERPISELFVLLPNTWLCWYV